MQILTIVENNRVTGVVYGMKEVGEPIVPVHKQKHQNIIQQRKNIHIQNHRTRQR